MTAELAVATHRTFTMVLGPAKPFVSEPGIRPKRVERNILRCFRQIDLVDVYGFRAIPNQNFLGGGLHLRGPDTDPHHETVPFGDLLQAQGSLAQQASPHTEYGEPCCG